MSTSIRLTRAVPVAAIVMLGLGGCAPSNPVVTLTVAPSATSDTPAMPCVRDAAMTDAESLARMSSPTTGEVWLDAPVQIPAPAWAVGDPFLDQEWVQWYEIGSREDRTVLTVGYDAGQYILERDALGAYTWIAFPSARDDASITLDDPTFAAIASDVTVCYDSLTFPDTFSLLGGEPLGWYGPDFGGVGTPGMGTGSPLPSGDTAATIGDFSILRVEESVSWIWSDPYPAAVEPPGLTYRHLYYLLITPYGMSIPLFYAPVGELVSVSWSVPTTFAENGDWVYLADLMDSICGERPHDQEAIVMGLTDDHWLPAGTTAGGEPVYVPSASNPLVQPLYNAYVGGMEARGESPVSMSEFVGAPGVIGYRSVDVGEWLVYLNGALSGRAWC